LAQVVEQAEFGHERSVSLAGPRAVAPAQLAERGAMLGRHTPADEIAAAHDVRRDEGEDGADLPARGVAVGPAVEARDLPDLDVVRFPAHRSRRVRHDALGFLYVFGAEPVVDEDAVGVGPRGFERARVRGGEEDWARALHPRQVRRSATI